MDFLKMIADKLNEGREYGAAVKLANAIGYKPPVVSEWVKGKKAPGPDAVAHMAKALKMPERDIKAFFPARYPAAAIGASAVSDIKPEDLQAVEVNNVPVVGYISSAYFKTCSFGSNTYVMEELLVKTTRGMNVKALKISGGMYEPEFHKDEYVLVAVGALHEQGGLVLAKVGDEYTIAYVTTRGQDAVLTSCDAAHTERRLKCKDLHIVGPILPDVVRKRAPSFFKK